MKQSDMTLHANILQRVIERNENSEDRNELVLLTLRMLQHEYAHAHEIFPVDPE